MGCGRGRPWPGYVAEVLQTLTLAGFQAFVVGDSVRDRLLGRLSHDHDVASEKIERRFQRAMNMVDLIVRSAKLYATRIAITSENRSLTYQEVNKRANKLVHALRSLGLQRQARVALLTFNDVHFLEFQFAMAKGSFVGVPLNARSRVQEHEYILKHSGAEVLIYSEAFAHEIPYLKERLPGLRYTYCLQNNGNIEDAEYEQLLKRHPSQEPDDINDDNDLLYMLFYSSGTTGKPKGVMLTQKNWIAVGINLLLEFGPVHRDDTILHLQPLSHGGGFFLLPYYMRGAHSVVPKRYDPVSTLELIEKHHITVLKLIPTMLIQILNEPSLAKYRLESLKTIIYGASPMPEDKLREAVDRFGPILTQLYGQAEFPMTISVLPKLDHLNPKLLRSAGRPWTLTEVRVVDEEGNVCPPNEIGEIIVRGEQMMKGYWRNEQLTKETIRNGWVYTRDLGYMNEDGYLFIVDRKSDMIITGGFNVYPREVEEVLHTHPAVLETVVFGVDDPVWIQRVVAAVVLRSGAHVSETELLDYAKEQLPSFKRPREVLILDTIPKNANGKIDRRAAKELYTSGVK